MTISSDYRFVDLYKSCMLHNRNSSYKLLKTMPKSFRLDLLSYYSHTLTLSAPLLLLKEHGAAL